MSNNKQQGNAGIIVNGGSINARDVVVGDNATITNNNNVEESIELKTLVAQLIAQMQQEGMATDKISAVEVAQSELAKEAPNDTVVSSILTSVMDSIKDVKAVSATVATIAELLVG